MKRRNLLLLLFFFFFTSFASNGCQVSVEKESIRDIQLTFFRTKDGAKPSDQYDLKQGVVPGHFYYFEISIYTQDGRIIPNPKNEEILLQSPNTSTSGLQVASNGKRFIQINPNSFQIRDGKIQFRIRIQNNAYEGRLYETFVDWERYNVFAFRGADGDRGSDGANGRDGEAGIPEPDKTDGTDGEHGQHGQQGAAGEHGPDLVVYATRYREQRDGQSIEGTLLKIEERGQTQYFFTKAQSISLTTEGGMGGMGGNAGTGGRGGDGSPEDPNVAPGRGGRGGDGGTGGAGGAGGNGGNVQFYFYGEANAGFVIRSLEGRGATGGTGAYGGEGGKSQRSDGAGERGYDGPNGEAGYDGRPGNILPSPMSLDLILPQFASLGVGAEHLSPK
jgi:hypothetical protein